MPLALYGVLALVIAILGKAESSVFDTARVRLTDWTAPMLEDVRAPLAVFERWTDNWTRLFALYEENAELRRENAELRKWQNVALSLETKVNRYALLLNAVPDPEMPAVTARLIGRTDRPFARTMIVNVGSDQGVRKGQAVIDDRGLIGRIYLLGDRTSWIIPLTDLSSRIPVMIESNHRRAILAGDNTAAPVLELDSGEEAVRAGDRVLSTGDGGLLPPDIPVGVVIPGNGTLRVALFAEPNGTDFVQIVNYRVPVEPPSADGEAPPTAEGPAAEAPAMEAPPGSAAESAPVAPAATEPRREAAAGITRRQ